MNSIVGLTFTTYITFQLAREKPISVSRSLCSHFCKTGPPFRFLSMQIHSCFFFSTSYSEDNWNSPFQEGEPKLELIKLSFSYLNVARKRRANVTLSVAPETSMTKILFHLEFTFLAKCDTSEATTLTDKELFITIN